MTFTEEEVRSMLSDLADEVRDETRCSVIVNGDAYVDWDYLNLNPLVDKVLQKAIEDKSA